MEKEQDDLGLFILCYICKSFDIHSHMLDIYEGLGEQGTIPLHGKYGDTMDNTHLSQQGATIVCEYIVSQMVEQNMDISKFIKEEYKLK